MKFNSRPVIAVYHFWICVTQVPFTSVLAVTFLCVSHIVRVRAARRGASLHRCIAVPRRRVASGRDTTRRDASRRAIRLHGCTACGPMVFSMRCAAPLFSSGTGIRVEFYHPRPQTSSVSNLGSPACANIRALMKLRKFRRKYRATACADFSFSSSGNRNNFRARAPAPARAYALHKTANRSYEQRVKMNNGRDVKNKTRAKYETPEIARVTKYLISTVRFTESRKRKVASRVACE